MARNGQGFHSAGLIYLIFSTWNDLCGYVAVLKAQVVEVTPNGPRILYFNSLANCSPYLHVVNLCVTAHVLCSSIKVKIARFKPSFKYYGC